MVSTKKSSDGFTVRDVAVILFLSITVILFYMFLNAVTAHGQKQVNPTSDVLFRTQEDINPEQMQRMVDWITGNFNQLYKLSKYDVIKISEGDSVVIKLSSSDNGVLIVKR